MISLINIQVSETGTPIEPVSLDDLKDWVKVDFTDDDGLITSIGISAREDIEQELNLKLVESTALFYLETTKEGEAVTQFPYALNLAQVSDVVVNLLTDGEADALQVINDDYYLNGSLKLVSAGRNKVEYSITPVVPNSLKEAIKMLVAYRYNNRGDQEKQQGIPEDVMSKISKYRQIWL